MSPKLEMIGFRSHGHVPKAEHHDNDGCSGFPKVKSQSYQSKTKQNNSIDLLGHSFLQFELVS